MSDRLNSRRGTTAPVSGDSPRRDESGAVLILALIYILVIGLVVGTLSTWASNDLNNTTEFDVANQIHSVAASVTNTAIQSIRYSPMPASTPTQDVPTSVGNCWTPSAGSPASQLTIDGYTFASWCTTTENNSSSNTRTVTVYTCQSALTSSSTGTAISQAISTCVADPVVQAQVIFDDYPSGGSVLLSTQCNIQAGQCGYGQTLVYWRWG